jgi:oxygen-independent coproporphyrinogen III oxidase
MPTFLQHHTLDTHVVVDPELIRRYDQNGPRYTSYPTADRFVEAYDAQTHARTLGGRNVAGTVMPLSLYVHIPFCNTICFYCACNKISTGDHGRSARYLRYVEREAKLTAQQLAGGRRVTQLHLGGGTPTFLNNAEIEQLMQSLGRHFELALGEYSIEIDPRTVDREKLATLARLGFNRISVGVQDFNPDVQRAVNRVQSIEETNAVFMQAREHGMTSINMDLIYGLPKQNVVGFNQTLDQVIKMRPDRVALYSYAHLPQVFKPQRRIADEDLPTAEAKLQIMTLAIRRLTREGYIHIGMDHFALPHDELAIAARRGSLHRNFQGYSTQADCDLVALGVSAISKVGSTYSQNVRTLDEYYDALDRAELPVLRGVSLSADDLLRRAVIQTLMCQFELSIEGIELAHLINFRRYFANEWARLEELESEGLVELDDAWITVTSRGRLLVRAIAMTFDRYLQNDRERTRFSKVI